jgi:hypothetical protein
MGWSNCGTDSRGRPIGYAHRATCDHVSAVTGKKCKVKIDRGLAYACGGMHGADEFSCEGYFCPKHLFYSDNEEVHGQLCKACCDAAFATVGASR